MDTAVATPTGMEPEFEERATRSAGMATEKSGDLALSRFWFRAKTVLGIVLVAAIIAVLPIAAHLSVTVPDLDMLAALSAVPDENAQDVDRAAYCDTVTSAMAERNAALESRTISFSLSIVPTALYAAAEAVLLVGELISGTSYKEFRFRPLYRALMWSSFLTLIPGLLCGLMASAAAQAAIAPVATMDDRFVLYEHAYEYLNTFGSCCLLGIVTTLVYARHDYISATHFIFKPGQFIATGLKWITGVNSLGRWIVLQISIPIAAAIDLGVLMGIALLGAAALFLVCVVLMAIVFLSMLPGLIMRAIDGK